MTSPTGTASAPSARLGNGELRRMVARVLADHPPSNTPPATSRD
ncbi:hypothetical protein [Nocardia nova]|nr:hypothetical protein [Nocardia nova]